MKKILAYCLNCEEEVEMTVDSVIYNDEIKIEGKCFKCGNYLCRVFPKESQLVS